MYTICYVSSARVNITEDELTDLFGITEKNNIGKNITGILLYESGKFLQVLEGEETVLKNLYEKIEADSRHNNIFVILNQKCKRRIFEKYASRFSIVKSKEELQTIEIYLNQIEDSPNLKYVKGLLEPFLL
ncbi:MAG: BLUF domain-containing protein [Bacteroidia bacterium]|nr:BLUF domain-containing protein [Bacteroidia bacterium]NNJ81326.1 BLUF domain-containing protein [Flavobacteriaceae bacterium]NNK53361.1 BLUF domain-containing protein [Flavobacteriaceae bacterium]